MSGNDKFRVFPWQEPFLPALKDFIYEASEGLPGQALVITPNRRPWRYLSALYKSDKKAMVLPKMMAINDLVDHWSAAIAPVPMYKANVLDQVALLHDCVKEAARGNDLLEKRFSPMGIHQFLPWGMRLAQLLEEFAVEGIQPENMPNMEGELSRPAAAIMDAIGSIWRLYNKKLEERKWTTAGLESFRVMRSCGEIPHYFRPAPERPVIIAGFHILSGSHNIILQSLWKNGAYVCLHTDPALAGGGRPHWSCAPHVEWLDRWDASCMAATAEAPAEDRTGWHFFAGFDLHSQLARLKDVLAEPSDASTAVILGRNETLMPALHALPRKDVNVSMGYPLERTPLYMLLEDTLRMHENSFGENRFNSEDALKIIRHPYINMLSIDSDGHKENIRAKLKSLEAQIRERGRYWDCPEVEEPGECATAEDLYAAVLYNFFRAPRKASTPAAFARLLKDICLFLIKYCKKIWVDEPHLDVETMYRLLNSVLPILRQNAIAGSTFPLASLHEMYSQLARAERIPFEADPVEGLQVMGLLESRLLQFDRVIFVDATDDVIPGNSAQDLLMPDSLRYLFNLPDGARREKTAAYNFFRLCKGAREAHVLWQESAGNSDFYDSKKVRSRFVEEPIWKAEKVKPVLLDTPNGPVEFPRPLLRIPEKSLLTIERGQELEKAMDRFFDSPINATSLDSYFQCPLQFVWSSILNIYENDEDAQCESQIAGKFVHKLLYDLYRGWGQKIVRVDILKGLKEKIADEVDRLAREYNLADKLSYHSFLTLKKTIPIRLEEYFQNQPEETTVLALECGLASSVAINGKNYALEGRVDRIDVRGKELVVLDYKTGKSIPKNNQEFWNDADFFGRVEEALREYNVEQTGGLWSELCENCSGLQLPIYLLLLEKSKFAQNGRTVGNAGWIPLRFGGVETMLLAEEDGEANKQAINHCRLALGLTLAHIRSMPKFTAEETEKCQDCCYRNLCFS